MWASTPPPESTGPTGCSATSRPSSRASTSTAACPGAAHLNAGYAISRNPTSSYSFNTGKANGRVNANTFFTGAVYRFTPALSWNVGYYDVSDQTPAGSRTNGLSMFATGLTWSPYKDWDFFADYAAVRRQAGATGAFTIYDRWVPDTSTARNCVPTTPTAAGCSDSTGNQSGFSVGAQFKF